MDKQYNKHYIVVNDNGYIIDIWSDNQAPNRPTDNAILYNGKGGIGGARLIVDGVQTEENPQLTTDDGVYLYKWTGKKAVRRTDKEIEADRAAQPEPIPQPDIPTLIKTISDLGQQLTDTQMALCEIYEGMV